MMFGKSNTPTPAPVNKTLRATPTAGAPSLIAADVRIIGNMSAKGEIQLDGIVEGDVRADTLIVGDSGAIKGAVSADAITVRGVVEGQIRCRSVRLEKTARVKGDVWHETVSVEAGAMLEGHFVHTQNNNDKIAKVVGDIADHAKKPAVVVNGASVSAS